MYQAEVTIGIVTPMFSYGADQKTAEFRIPEIKSLMRRTFLDWFEDEFDVDNNGEEVLEKTKCSEILFGSTGRKSPLTIRLKEQALIWGKKDNKSCLDSGGTVTLILETRKETWMKFYLFILEHSSKKEGLGKKAKKFGKFEIRSVSVRQRIRGREKEINYNEKDFLEKIEAFMKELKGATK